LSAQAYADVRRGGGLPPAVLKNTQQVLDSDAASAIRERAVAAFRSGKPFVTGSDWDLNISVIPPSHAQFIETLKLTAGQIAAIYGIDPREIGGEAAGSLTYSTDESRSLNRANDMRPYMVRLENAFNRLLPERQFVKLNVDATIPHRHQDPHRRDRRPARTGGCRSTRPARSRTGPPSRRRLPQRARTDLQSR
jgi:phage portal protein BeeE